MVRSRSIRLTCWRIWQKVWLLALTMMFWLALHGEVLAAKAAKKVGEAPEKPGGPTSWTMPYGLVILGIALGMLFVCRPSRRRDRARPQQYGEGQSAG